MSIFAKRAERFLSVMLSVTMIVWTLGVVAFTPVAAATLNEGDLIKTADRPHVYIINAYGFKRHIFNPEVFNMYGHLKWENIKVVDNDTANSYKTSDLYIAENDPKVYSTTEDGKKSWFHMTADEFVASGYSWNQVFQINAKEAAFYPDGPEITYTPAVVTTNKLTVALASDNPASGSIVAGQANADLAHISFANGTSSEVKVTDVKLMRTGVSADTTPSSVYLFDGATRLTDAATVSDGYVNFNNSAGIFTVAAGATKTIKVLANIATGTSGQTVGVKVVEVKTSSSATVEGTPSGNLMTVATATVATVDFNTTTTPSSNTTTDPVNDYTAWQNVITIGQRAVNMSRLSLREIGSINYSDINNFRLYVDGVQVGSAVANLDSNGYVTFDLSSSPKKLDTGSRTIRVNADIIGGSNRNFSFSLRNAADVSFSDTSYNVDVLATAASSTFSARTTGTITVNAGTLTVTKKTDSVSGTVVDAATDITLGSFEFKAAGEKIKVETLRVTIVSSDTDTGASKFRNGRLLLDGAQVGSTADIYEASNSTQAYTEYTVNFTVTPGTPRTLEVRADAVDNQGTDSVSNGDTLTVRLVAGDLNNAQGLVSGTVVDAPSTSTNVDGNTLTVGVGSLTLSKYSAYANHTVVAPKTAYKIGHFVLTGSTTEATNLTQFSVDFTGADAFSATNDLDSVYIKYGSNTTSPKSTSSLSATSNTWAISSELAAGASMDVEIYATIASASTDGDGTADTMATALTVTGMTVKSSTSVTGGATTGQTITSGASSISGAASTTTPLAQVVAGNQTVNVAKFDWTAVSEAYTVSEMRLELNPTVNTADTASSVVTNVILKKSDGSTIATLPLNYDEDSDGTVDGVNFTGLNIAAPIGVTTVFVDLQLGTIGTGSGTSGANIDVELDRFKSYSDSVDEAPTSPSSQSGNNVYVYKSIPTLTQVDLTNTSAIGNGTAQDVYKFSVVADSKGNIDVKQFKINVAWTDAGTTAALELESVKLYETTSEGTNDITSLATLQDEDGNTVTGTNGLLEDDGTLVVTFSTPRTVEAGKTNTYAIRATPQAFGNETTEDRVSLYALDDTSAPTSGYTYLNAGTSTTTITKLYSSATANASATDHNFIWSDRSDESHSGTTGDWTNGYLVKNLPLGGETWSD